jgi:hypothetical protein
MISFGFEDSFAVSFDDFEGLEAGTAFRGLTDTIGRIETFFLVRTKAGTGTRGTETEAGTGVALAVETFGIVGIVGIAGKAGAGAGTGVALGMEAFSSCARLNKNSR